jgi:hypothetical protein
MSKAKFIESRQPTDYQMNIDELATEGYNFYNANSTYTSNYDELKGRTISVNRLSPSSFAL